MLFKTASRSKSFVLGIRDVTYELKHSREANPFNIEKKFLCVTKLSA